MTQNNSTHGEILLADGSAALKPPIAAPHSLVPNAEIIEQAAHAAIEALRHDVLGAEEAVRSVALDHALPSVPPPRAVAANPMRDLAALPDVAVGGLQDMQQAMADLAAGVLRANVNAVQDLMRLSSPAGVIELQQRFIQDYMQALMQGSTALARGIRRVADAAQAGARS